MKPTPQTIQNLRNQLGLTQQATADLLGFSKGHITHCESGNRVMSAQSWGYQDFPGDNTSIRWSKINTWALAGGAPKT